MNSNHKSKKRKKAKIKLNVDSLHKIRELEQEKILLQALHDFIYEDKISSDILMKSLRDNMKNLMVPIKAYVDMILDDHFGSLNGKQKEKLEIIKKCASSLNQQISHELDSKK